MNITLVAELQWIRADSGGRTHPPVVGLRPTVRFQRYIAEWSSGAWDAEIVAMDLDQDTWRGTAELRFVKDAVIKPEWSDEGELIELLDGYRVIAVGKIKEVSRG